MKKYRVLAIAPKGKEFLYNPKTAIYTNYLPKKHEQKIIEILNDFHKLGDDKTYHAYYIDCYDSAFVYCQYKLIWKNSIKLKGHSFS